MIVGIPDRDSREGRGGFTPNTPGWVATFKGGDHSEGMKVMTLNLAHGRNRALHQVLVPKKQMEVNLQRIAAALRDLPPEEQERICRAARLPDLTAETLRQTGTDMQSKYRETSRGGLAVNVPEC